MGVDRAPVGHSDHGDQVFWAGLGVLHVHIEITVIGEHARVEQLVLEVVARPLPVGAHEVVVRVGRLGIFVEQVHVGVSRGVVDVEVILLHVLAVIALRIGEAKEPLLQDRVSAVPQRQGQAELLAVVAYTGDTVFPPAVSA